MGTRWKRLLPLVAVVALATGLVACGADDEEPNPTATTSAGGAAASASGGAIPANIGKDDKANLTGAGATFPAPVYQAWFADYNKVAKDVRVNYQSIGSGGGVQQFTEKTVDFGASDAPLSDAELAKVPGAQHIPTVLGSVVVTYNVEGLTAPLKFDGDTLSKIWLGTIKKWNDPAIAALNPGAKLPDAAISVVSRSDGSGTSYVWTDYLSKVSPDWKTKVGTNKNPNWPVGQGGKGNEGVANGVKQTKNSIGYVELNYAVANKLAYGDVKNSAGKFVTPSIASTSAAAAGVPLPEDYRVSITNPSGDAAYPIASFTYLLVHKDAPSCSTAVPLVHMLWWLYHDPGPAASAAKLDYAPLPEKVLPNIEATLKALKCEGKPIL